MEGSTSTSSTCWSSSSSSKPISVHALLLSFPIPTHLNPLLLLARRLSSSSTTPTCNFVFTSIVSFHMSTSSPNGLQQSASLEQDGFTLRTIAVPDGLPFSHPRSSIFDVIRASDNMKAPVEQFIPHLLQTSPPLTCIISDVFVLWAPQVATRFGLPLFSFFTSNATACCVMSHAPHLVSQGIIPFRDASLMQPITCPGAPPLLPKEFPLSMQSEDLSHLHLQFTLKMFLHLEQAAGLILNSISEFEPEAIKYLQTRCKVYAVGPLFLSSRGEIEEKNGFITSGENECIQWLDAQAPKSVLYVSFGTLSTFSDGDQMKELALGLEDSEQPFLWVIRRNAIHGSVADVLPEGFLERTKGRCFITSWAPQMQVLRHPSVGAFLSHCGWNSILENIALQGLPTLCWPDKAEQGVNARILTDHLRLGLKMEGREDGKIRREEVMRKVLEVMKGEKSEKMRKRGAELKQQAEGAVKSPQGSTFCNLRALVEDAMKERTKEPTNE